jgi:hypothetical protein
MQATVCPGRDAPERPATLAGGALAEVIAGAALIQAQRVVTGNDVDLALGREVTIDLTHMHLMSAQIPRSRRCLSGHIAWELTPAPAEASTTLGDVAGFIARDLGRADFMLEPFGHPLCIEAGCGCGASMVVVGSVWADSPVCGRCGAPMTWRTESQRAALHPAQINELRVGDRTLNELGLPQGAMFSARVSERFTRRYVIGVNVN